MEPINYCGACGPQQNPIGTVCKACRKSAREVFKEYTTDEEFMRHSCDHVTRNPKLKITRWGCSAYKIPYPHLNTLGRPDSQCALCVDEMRKELAQRYKRNRKNEVNQTRATESLFTKCCKLVAMDPGLILLAVSHQPPLTEQMWEAIYNEVPVALNKEYNEALDESREVNEAHWMYRTIGEVFSRYIRRTRGRHF